MSRTFVRTTWASDLNHRARRALRLLSEQEDAAVSERPTDVVDGDLNIHSEAAIVLVRQGYAESLEEQRIKVTDDGLRKIGKLTESRSERRRRREAESLEAQASGKWVPAPAGASATAVPSAEPRQTTVA